MSMIDLALAKAHLRVDDGSCEDSLILAYLEAAEDSACRYLNRNVYATVEDADEAKANGDETAMSINSSFIAAVLLIVGDLYENREVSSGADPKINDRAIRLLTPYRVGWGV